MADLTFDAWWQQVGAAALVGTARRSAPTECPLPVVARPSADRETALLDQLAVGMAVQAAGVLPTLGRDAPDPAPDDPTPVAPPRTVQLLELALTQTPGGPGMRAGLVAAWSQAGAAYGVRVPHRLLPGLLDLLLAHRAVIPDVAPVLGARGRWLADQLPTWEPLRAPIAAALTATDAAPDATDPAPPGLPETWLHLPVPEQVAHLARLHAADPVAALDRLCEVWGSASAKDRSAYLQVVAGKPDPADEDFLDAALDDRAATVRLDAARLLERHPGSARAHRMADRLHGLISTPRALLRRTVAVALPEDPDPPAVRDGLGPAPKGRSVRGHHLAQIVAGAPLSVWQDATGMSPTTILMHLSDRDAATEDVRAGLHRAAVAQQDRAWARALLDDGLVNRRRLDADLLAVLDPREGESLLVERLADVPAEQRTEVLLRIPGPWSAALSRAIVRELRRRDTAPPTVTTILGYGVECFDPVVVPALQSWLDNLPATHPSRTVLARALSTITFRQSISEAFR